MKISKFIRSFYATELSRAACWRVRFNLEGSGNLKQLEQTYKIMRVLTKLKLRTLLGYTFYLIREKMYKKNEETKAGSATTIERKDLQERS